MITKDQFVVNPTVPPKPRYSLALIPGYTELEVATVMITGPDGKSLPLVGLRLSENGLVVARWSAPFPEGVVDRGENDCRRIRDLWR